MKPQGGSGVGSGVGAGVGGSAVGEVRDAEFDLPWPPSVNNYYRHVGPRVLISREGRRYRRMVTSRLGGLFPKFTGKVRLALDCYPPDRRRRDLDNLCKSLQDTLQHAGLYEDDSQIKDLRLRMREPAPPDGRVALRAAPCREGADDEDGNP